MRPEDTQTAHAAQAEVARLLVAYAEQDRLMSRSAQEEAGIHQALTEKAGERTARVHAQTASDRLKLARLAKSCLGELVLQDATDGASSKLLKRVCAASVVVATTRRSGRRQVLSSL
jgi:hypothetical protein